MDFDILSPIPTCNDADSISISGGLCRGWRGGCAIMRQHKKRLLQGQDIHLRAIAKGGEMKTVLLGMNSPTGKVLEYYRSNSAGGRLLKLSEMSPMVYTLCFQRMNVLDSVEWDDDHARWAGIVLRKKFVREGRTVVALGEKVWEALGLEKIEWLESARDGGAKFYSIPHTSGRCLWYNEHGNRKAVTRLLRRLAEEEWKR